jgi:hypothetical protein
MLPLVVMALLADPARQDLMVPVEVAVVTPIK